MQIIEGFRLGTARRPSSVKGKKKERSRPQLRAVKTGQPVPAYDNTSNPTALESDGLQPAEIDVQRPKENTPQDGLKGYYFFVKGNTLLWE